FPLQSLQVNFGNGVINSYAINDTNTSIQYAYPTAGTYTLTASATDTNSQVSPTFVANLTILPYIPPYISTITPTSVNAGVNESFNVTVVQGLEPISNLTIYWQGQNPLGLNAVTYTNITNGTNTLNYTYMQNGTFFVYENLTDALGVSAYNTTVMNVLTVPWTITPSEQEINYTIYNSTPPTMIAPFYINFTGNATLPVTVSVEQTTIAGAYACYPTVTSTPSYQFRVYCTLNPFVSSYPSQPIDFMITARTSDGITKNILVIVNVISELPPALISTPFNPNLYVAQPLPVLPAVPITGYELLLVITFSFAISGVLLYWGLR
ncbi:MAG: hypothetical protein QW478_12985, partial [Candidatus Micrarchaeaceae archaeon]